MRRPLRRLHMIWWAILAPVLAVTAGYGLWAALNGPEAQPAPAALFDDASGED